MNPTRTTRLLILLVLASSAVCWIAYARFTELRDQASIARTNLTLARQDLSDIARMKQGGGRLASAALDTPELSRQLRAAASAAGLPDVPDAEPGSPGRLGASDYTQTMVFLHFAPLTTRQLITFLHHLAQADPSSRVKQIELGDTTLAGTALPATARELWDAGVAVAYLTYSPRAGPSQARP